jgi:hypothetical protein
MIIEYDVHCFERTLKIELDDEYEHLKEAILSLLDDCYTQWHNIDSDMCLEEFMVTILLETYEIPFYKGWESIPYGEDYEPRETMWVCEHCLMAIESREGNQATLRHSVDERDAVESRCDWCRECGYSVLYELI